MICSGNEHDLWVFNSEHDLMVFFWSFLITFYLYMYCFYNLIHAYTQPFFYFTDYAFYFLFSKVSVRSQRFTDSMKFRCRYLVMGLDLVLDFNYCLSWSKKYVRWYCNCIDRQNLEKFCCHCSPSRDASLVRIRSYILNAILRLINNKLLINC